MAGPARWLITHEHISFPINPETEAPSSTPRLRIRFPGSVRIRPEIGQSISWTVID
jgi:hypothetical protein